MKRATWRRAAALLAALLVCAGAMTVTADGTPSNWLYEVESGETPEDLILADGSEWLATGTVPTDAAALEIGGKGAVLMDMDTGTVLYEHDSHTRLPIASVTKIMTLLLILEALEDGRITTDTMVTCSAEAASMGGSQIWLEEGETMSVHDLLKAIAVVSANDACAMMAEHLSGSVSAFVAEMNRRAVELGMVDTQFLDCCGLDDTAYSSAYDVALMSRALMRYPAIQQYTTIWMDTLRGGESQLVNTNKLVRFYKGATGLKTGTTQAAGHCLSATAERNGLRLCAVILGCATTDERFGGARAMLDYGFANYAIYTPSVTAEQLTPVRVLHGVRETVDPAVPQLSRLLLKKGEESKVTCEVTLAADVEAPVYAGETIGQVTVRQEDAVLAIYPIVAAEPIQRLGIWGAFCRLLAALAL